MQHPDTAVIVTTFCGEPNAELKKHMTKTLCRRLKEQDLFVCLAAHSIVSEDIQQYCDVVIYDKDNRMQFNGQPSITDNHGVAELTSIHNALNCLHRFGFQKFYKLAYDCNPSVNYDYIISKSKAHEKRMVTSRWHYSRETLSTLGFLCDIEFFRNFTPFEQVLPRMNHAIEDVLFQLARERNLFDDICLYDSYEQYLECDHVQFCHHGGKTVEGYPY